MIINRNDKDHLSTTYGIESTYINPRNDKDHLSTTYGIESTYINPQNDKDHLSMTYGIESTYINPRNDNAHPIMGVAASKLVGVVGKNGRGRKLFTRKQSSTPLL
jgi:hypothetical protein